MKRHRHTPEQIVRKLREGDRLLNERKDLTDGLHDRTAARTSQVLGLGRSTRQSVVPP
jgi:hypothetical protein